MLKQDPTLQIMNSKDHYKRKNMNKIQLMENESGRKKMTELALLRKTAYSYLTDDSDEN